MTLSCSRYTLAFLATIALSASPCLAEPSEAQQSSWSEQREQSKTLHQRAESIRIEADQVYAQEESACFEELLTNRCREAARRKKVSAYQHAKTLDIESRQIELAVRREEKAQKEIDFAAATPDRAFKTQQRIDATEKRNQEQAKNREKAEAKRQDRLKNSTSDANGPQ